MDGMIEHEFLAQTLWPHKSHHHGKESGDDEDHDDGDYYHDIDCGGNDNEQSKNTGSANSKIQPQSSSLNKSGLG